MNAPASPPASPLVIEDVHKAFGGQPVLRGASLDVPDRVVLALLGPSGCGKTTLLRAAAGFDAISRGRIAVAGRAVAGPGLHVPPERRRIGYVPQEGTLFPHLTIAGNVGFGLSRAERRAGRVEEMLRLTGLEGLGARYPHQVSGGQQQRTALARALAPRPALVLLDEPFAALDLDLRRTVCADVCAALRAAGAAALLVTHDPQEALASADLLAVMEAGVVVQAAGPVEVYRRPATPGVARLTGPALFLPGHVRDGMAETPLGPVPLHPSGPATGEASVMLRPEQVVVRPDGVPAAVLAAGFRGDHMQVEVAVGPVRLTLRLPPGALGADDPSPGSQLRLGVLGAGCGYAAGAMYHETVWQTQDDALQPPR